MSYVNNQLLSSHSRQLNRTFNDIFNTGPELDLWAENVNMQLTEELDLWTEKINWQLISKLDLRTEKVNWQLTSYMDMSTGNVNGQITSEMDMWTKKSFNQLHNWTYGQRT